MSPNIGDLEYLATDKDKTQARSRYLVISVEDPWYYVKKFSGNQLRALSYKVKISECLLVPDQSASKLPPPPPPPHSHRYQYSSDEECEESPYNTHDVPPVLAHPVDITSTSYCSPNPVSLSSSSDERVIPINQRPQREHKPPDYYGYS